MCWFRRIKLPLGSHKKNFLNNFLENYYLCKLLAHRRQYILIIYLQVGHLTSKCLFCRHDLLLNLFCLAKFLEF